MKKSYLCSRINNKIYCNYDIKNRIAFCYILLPKREKFRRLYHTDMCKLCDSCGLIYLVVIANSHELGSGYLSPLFFYLSDFEQEITKIFSNNI